MANTVIALKKSSTPSAEPVNLANGELAINFADGKLFYKNSTGQIVSFTSGSNSFGTVNANGTLIISDTVGDVLTIEAGNNISIVGDAINDKITISATGGGANVAVSTSQIKDLTSNDYVITSVTPVSQVVDSALMSAAFDKANAANVLAFNTGIGANAYAASIANTIAIAAFNQANNALTNSTGTFAGSLTITGDLIAQGNVTLGDSSTDTIILNGSTISLGNNQNIDAGTLFIDGTNNRIGIGTITSSQITSLDPYSRFTIRGIDNTAFTSGIENYGSGQSGFYVYRGGTFAARWYQYIPNGLQNYVLTPGGGVSFTFTTNNYLGIGTTSPTSNLHVIGNANITSNLIVQNIDVIPAISSAYDKANSANVLAFNTGIGANSFTSATIAGANTAVGAGANAFTSATVSGANTIAIAAFDKANTGGGGSGSLTTYSANVGNGAANTYNVSHNLNSYSLLMTMREIATGYIIYPDLQQTTSNNLVISFVDNPTANQYALLIAKVT